MSSSCSYDEVRKALQEFERSGAKVVAITTACKNSFVMMNIAFDKEDNCCCCWPRQYTKHTEAKMLALHMIFLRHLMGHCKKEGNERGPGQPTGIPFAPGHPYELAVDGRYDSSESANNDGAMRKRTCQCSIDSNGMSISSRSSAQQQQQQEEEEASTLAGIILDAWMRRKIKLFTLIMPGCIIPMSRGTSELLAASIIKEKQAAEEMVKEKKLALCMGLHVGLGRDSMLRLLPADALGMVCNELENESMQRWGPVQVLEDLRDMRARQGLVEAVKYDYSRW